MAHEDAEWKQLLLPCPSPCVKHCGIDESLKCSGCHRTGREIAAWPTLPDELKWKLLFELPKRANPQSGS